MAKNSRAPRASVAVAAGRIYPTRNRTHHGPISLVCALLYLINATIYILRDDRCSKPIGARLVSLREVRGSRCFSRSFGTENADPVFGSRLPTSQRATEMIALTVKCARKDPRAGGFVRQPHRESSVITLT